MADDKLKRGAGSSPRDPQCGICGKASPPCPSCPRIDRSERTDDSREWAKLRGRNPAEYAVQHACAVAARRLVITHESHHLFPAYLDDYRRACDARDRYWEGLRAKLAKPQGSRHSAFQSPAEAVSEALT